AKSGRCEDADGPRREAIASRRRPATTGNDERSELDLADLDLFVVSFEDDGLPFARLLRRAREARHVDVHVRFTAQQIAIDAEIMHDDRVHARLRLGDLIALWPVTLRLILR